MGDLKFLQQCHHQEGSSNTITILLYTEINIISINCMSTERRKEGQNLDV